MGFYENFDLLNPKHFGRNLRFDQVGDINRHLVDIRHILGNVYMKLKLRNHWVNIGQILVHWVIEHTLREHKIGKIEDF